MTGIITKLILSTVVGSGATAGVINETVKAPSSTIDVVIAQDPERTMGCTHARVYLSEEAQELLHLENKPFLLHITNYDQDGKQYTVGEKLTIPLDVSGFEVRTVGYTGYSFYSPEEYITRQEG